MPDEDKNVTATPQGDKTDLGDGTDKTVPYARFKEINDAKKALEAKNAALEEAERKRQEAADKAAGNFQKVADDARKEADTAKAELANAKRYNKFLTVASAVGINDPEVAYSVLPTATDDEDMESLVEKLVETKPYFLNKEANIVPEVPTGGGHKPPHKPKMSFTQFIRGEANK